MLLAYYYLKKILSFYLCLALKLVESDVIPGNSESNCFSHSKIYLNLSAVLLKHFYFEALSFRLYNS